MKSQHSSPPHSACRRIRSRRSVCYWLAGCTRYITNAPLASQQKIYLHSLFLPAKTHKCLKPARNDSYPNSSEDAFNYTEKRTLNFSRCVGKFSLAIYSIDWNPSVEKGIQIGQTTTIKLSVTFWANTRPPYSWNQPLLEYRKLKVLQKRAYFVIDEFRHSHFLFIINVFQSTFIKFF